MNPLRRVLRPIEPDYDWSRSTMETMDRAEEVDVFHFEVDWFGIVASFHVGRRKTARAIDY